MAKTTLPTNDEKLAAFVRKKIKEHRETPGRTLADAGALFWQIIGYVNHEEDEKNGIRN